MGNGSHAATYLGISMCGPASMCSGNSCGECRACCAAANAVGFASGASAWAGCSRAPPSKYEYPGIGQSAQQGDADAPSPLSARGLRSGDSPCHMLTGFSSPSSASPTSEVGGGGGGGGQAQHLVRNFVRGIVKGISATLLSAPGGPVPCVVSLDRGLKTMILKRIWQVANAELPRETSVHSSQLDRRTIPLEQVCGIVLGDDVLGDAACLAAEASDLCVTLLLEGGQAVTLGFPDLEERDTFALCLSMFVDGRRVEAPRRRQL
mmetsp:Transcript_103877/g.292327  ORF Transcript_103877/g.292327 Transcript_103877/m.292327 type:complete len:264 (-) Transcript_103877:34-825(-)